MRAPKTINLSMVRVRIEGFGAGQNKAMRPTTKTTAKPTTKPTNLAEPRATWARHAPACFPARNMANHSHCAHRGPRCRQKARRFVTIVQCAAEQPPCWHRSARCGGDNQQMRARQTGRPERNHGSQPQLPKIWQRRNANGNTRWRTRPPQWLIVRHAWHCSLFAASRPHEGRKPTTMAASDHADTLHVRLAPNANTLRLGTRNKMTPAAVDYESPYAAKPSPSDCHKRHMRLHPHKRYLSTMPGCPGTGEGGHAGPGVAHAATPSNQMQTRHARHTVVLTVPGGGRCIPAVATRPDAGLHATLS